MTRQPQFPDLASMESSEWLTGVKDLMAQGRWPIECERCMETELENGTSIRTNAIKFDSIQTQEDYLTVGGVLDNVCNSACLTCDENHSTLIGGLKSRTYSIVDNSSKFWDLPLNRIVHLDISGGEPSYSKNYKHILANLPENIRSVRLNTNCSTVLEELLDLCNRRVHVDVTVSLDGIGPVHDLVRYPIKWDKFYANLQRYMEMPVKLNTWTTVSVLNIDDLPNILEFVKHHKLDHNYAYLKQPAELAVENKDTLESIAYIQKQKQLRGIR